MAKKTKSTTKRFGARYGRTLKKRFGAIEALQKSKHTCPNCNYPKVKRLAVGIWICNNCNKKFTSRAYSVSKPTRLRSKTMEEEL
jgi:large subunit ribosomal protein L37Ae